MLLVNMTGIALIALIIWWFWLYQPKEVEIGNDDLVVIVENGSYQPPRIRIPADQSAKLQFIRKDPSPCAETLVLPDLEISENLPLNKIKTIEIPPLAAGEYDFHCQMKMYRGSLKVE
jgi:plastocyanin domain-containing protein